MNETLEIIQSEFAQASFETFEMVLISMIAAAILGTILGLVLHLASNPIFIKTSAFLFFPCNLYINVLK